MCLIFLQASCLRSLLYLLSLSAFDAIEFVGRADNALIKGRRLYISRVSKYTYVISVGIVLISIAIVVAAICIRQMACFMIQGREGDMTSQDMVLQITIQLSRVLDMMEGRLVDRSEDATMGALLKYLERSTYNEYMKAAGAVLQRLSSLLAPSSTHLFSLLPSEWKNSVTVCESSSSQLPSLLSSLLVHRTLSLSSYITTRLGIFCIAVLGIARVLLPKSS